MEMWTASKVRTCAKACSLLHQVRLLQNALPCQLGELCVAQAQATQLLDVAARVSSNHRLKVNAMG
jgi:hypothetical protein